jgi:HD-GYP domain-containing protein (c-di-GMP phosphodiesterase class II)
VVARLGGDDFAVIVPRSGALETSVLARRMIDMIAISAGPEPGTVTASAGIASFPRHAADADALARLAAGALYHAKQTGSDRLVTYEDERTLDLTPTERIDRLERQSRLSSVRALISAIDARDTTIHEHSCHVAELAVSIAGLLGLDEATIDRTGTAALLHDVGAIGISDEVLAAERMSEGSRRALREHAARSQQILAAAGLNDLLPIVRAHGEWWDGTGSPSGLLGGEIPIEARVLAVADAYDALISDRPHRAALSRRQARAEVSARAGTQFDPDVVAKLLESLDHAPFVSG